MALPNAEKLTSQMAMLPDAALKQMAMMHKNDPYVLPLIISEDGRRKQMRQAAQAQMGGMPQPKVADVALAQMGQLPENQGIGQLPTPNIQRMADGGIAGYEDDEEGMATGGMGGMFNFAQQSEPVVRMAGGGMTGYMPGFRDTGAVNAAFEAALQKTLKYEGGYVADDAGKGPSNFGINKSANPDVDIKNLTKDKARELYKKRYWDAIGGDALAAKDPALATIAFDTAVNMGVSKASQLIAQSKGDPSAMLNLRQQHYDNLIKDNPKKFAPFEKGWKDRVADLATSVIPSAQAGELPKAAPKDLVSQIPGSKVAPPAPGEKERYLTGNQGVIGTGETALQYLTGAAAMPLAGAYTALGQLPNVVSGKGADRAEMEKLYRERAGAMTYEPRTEGGRTVSESFGKTLEDLKIPAYIARIGAGTPKGPAARPSAEGIAGIAEQMKQVAAEKKAAVSTPRLEPPRTEKPKMVVDSEGRAMPEDSRTRVANAFDDLNAAEKAARDAAAYEKAAIEAKNAPDFSKYAGAMDESQLEAARARGISALASMTPSSIEAQKNAPATDTTTKRPEVGESVSGTYDTTMPKPSDLIAAAKEATPTKERKGFGNDDLLMLGLSLLANKSPNFMTALGEAGIQTLGAKKEREKAETDLEYKDIMKKYYGALGTKAEADAAYIKSGEKGRMADRIKAAQLIEDDLAAFRKTMEGSMSQPGAEAAKRRELTNYYFGLFGLDVPATMAATAPSTGFKVLGSRPQ
jgi:lysozyme family protein